MSDTTFMGVPRERIPWFPAIDYAKCTFCMECDTFCPHHVFERRESHPNLVVAGPDKEAIETIAERIAAQVDRILAETI